MENRLLPVKHQKVVLCVNFAPGMLMAPAQRTILEGTRHDLNRLWVNVDNPAQLLARAQAANVAAVVFETAMKALVLVEPIARRITQPCYYLNGSNVSLVDIEALRRLQAAVEGQRQVGFYSN